MRQFINGKECEVPTNPDGTVSVEVVRKAAGIPHGRIIIMKRANGSNEIINPDQNITLTPGQHLTDAPLHKKGC